MNTENQTIEQNSTAEQEPAWLKDCDHPSANNEPKAKPVFVIAYIKRHFLRISQATRAGKFNRVSQEAVDRLETALEVKLKELMRDVSDPHGQVEPDETFLTQEGKKKVLAAFNVWLAREMHRDVYKIRTGKTI